MSYLIGREQCPRCRKIGRDTSGDNLAVYSDGHKHCFACGFSSYKKKTVAELGKIISNDNITRGSFNHTTPAWPIDTSETIGHIALQWLAKYGLTPQEIRENFLWSEAEQQLIFYATDEEGQVLFWSARNFAPGRRKYHHAGDIRDIIVLLGDTDPVVLVEDVVSAIKVSRHAIAIPLFSAHVSNKLLARLRDLGYNNMVVWLDSDKAREAVKFARRANVLGIRAATIITPLDPKEYSDEKLGVLINERRTLASQV